VAVVSSNPVEQTSSRAGRAGQRHKRDLFAGVRLFNSTGRRILLCGRQSCEKVGTGRLCILISQLATLLGAGLSLVGALSALVEQREVARRQSVGGFARRDDRLTEILRQVVTDVNAGSSFSEALARYGEVFPAEFVGLVAAGEAGGRLEEVLAGAAEMFEKRLRITRKAKAAVVYPITMAIVAAAVVVFLLSVVVPGVTEVFVEMNRQLPLPTRMLISVSAFMRRYVLLMAFGFCAGAFGLRAWLGNRNARLRWDRWKLRVPVLGSLLLKLEVARLGRVLATLLGGGVSVLEALEASTKVVKNSFIADAVLWVRESVAKGASLAEAIRAVGVFPPVVYHVTATAQISANLEDGMSRLAEMYEQEVETATQAFVSLLEPAIVVAMGAIVAFIVAAILLPIFEMNQLF